MGSYLGGHTKVFVSESGTRWEVPDVPPRSPNSTSPRRWDSNIGVETGRSVNAIVPVTMCSGISQ